MPSRPCQHPTCTEYVAQPARYCPAHQQQGAKSDASRHTFYDQHQRDRAAKAFYNSHAWLRARIVKLTAQPTCEYPGCIAWADTVHHRKKLRDCSEAEKTAQENLKSLCAAHHNVIEAGIEKASHA